MASITIPPFEIMLEQYRPLWTTLYVVAEEALGDAAQKFRTGQNSFDGGVHAADARLNMKDRLDKRLGIEVEFEREQVNNCGLSIRYRDAYVKVYKSNDGEMPPAQTKAQKRHYPQPRWLKRSLWSLMLPGQEDEEFSLGELHLVAHWHIAPPPSLRFINLMLALPNGVGNPPFWNKPLPNPILSLVAVPAETSALRQGDNLVGIERLPFDLTGDR